LITKFGMVNCPTCKERVNYVYLRAAEPRCENNHPLGRWVMCRGANGSHVFLSKDNNDGCPVCGDAKKTVVPKGTKVKCMKPYAEGHACPTPEFEWLVEGPPCFLNHIDVMLVK